MASFVDTILQKIFPKGEEKVAVSGSIQWTDDLQKGYEAWKPSGIKVLKAIQTDISRQRVIDDSELSLQWYSDRAANGMVAELGSLMALPDDLRHLGKLLSERVAALNYRLYTAEHIVQEASSGIENHFWYYLKPIQNIEEGQTLHDQKFGNVKIELTREESQVRLKLLCTVYAGRNYSEPLPFNDLLKEVFDAD